MVRVIFKVFITVFLLLSFANANESLKGFLIKNDFQCERDHCKLVTSKLDVNYFFGDNFINVNAIGLEEQSLTSYCDLVFNYSLEEDESKQAREMLQSRIDGHNSYLDENLIFYSKTIYPHYVSVGFFNGVDKKHVSCYIKNNK